MLKVLRTYRTVALLTAFALVTTAFAPLSAVCGMDLAEPMPRPEAPVAPPCHDIGGMGMDYTTPMEHESPDDSDGSSDVMFTPSCCTAQGLTASKTERAAQLTAMVTEVIAETIPVASTEAHSQIAADGLPPPLPVSRHLLFGCFLT